MLGPIAVCATEHLQAFELALGALQLPCWDLDHLFSPGHTQKDIGLPLMVGDKTFLSGSLPGVSDQLPGEVWSDSGEPDPDPPEAPRIGGGGEGLRIHLHEGCLVDWCCFHRD